MPTGDVFFVCQKLKRELKTRAIPFLIDSRLRALVILAKVIVLLTFARVPFLPSSVCPPAVSLF
jgi:hypothetical protein